MNVHENLKYLREQAGLTLAELAEKTGIARATLSRWENSDSLPNIETAAMLAEFYGVSLDELTYGVKAGEDDGFEASPSAVTAQKLPLRYKIALCLAVGLCVLFAALFTISKIRQEKENPNHDIHVTQDETQTDHVKLNPNQGFDLVIPDE